MIKENQPPNDPGSNTPEAEPPEVTMPTMPRGSTAPSQPAAEEPAAPPEKTMPTQPSQAAQEPPPVEKTLPTDASAQAAPATADPGPATNRGFVEGEVILGRYNVEGELGKGGMGVVYKCLDTVGDVMVAVKTIPPEISRDESEMEEIRDNFRLVERLHHPHIAVAKTIEKDPVSGQYFLIMELADGINMRQYRKKLNGTLSISETIGLGRQIASALDYGHSEQIIHRDIKPANIMITDAGKVKLLDYGIASQYHESMSRVTNAKYETSGTGPYMAPEQWMGEFQDAKTDQYALAIVLYEMLVGKPPFTNPDLAILGQAVRNEKPKKPEAMTAQTWSAFQKALAKKRKDRYKSCAEFISALEDAQGGSHSVASKRKLHMAIAGLAGVLVLMLLAAAGIKGAEKRKASGIYAKASTAASEREWSSARELAKQALAIKPNMVEARALLDRLSERGRINLTSSPSQAEVWVKDVQVGTTPMPLEQMPGERIAFELRLPNYKPYSKSLVVNAGSPIDHHVSLEGMGKMMVNSNPDGATVYLNNKPVGRTPLALDKLSSGSYNLRLEREGFQPASKTVQFSASASQDVAFGDLAPLQGSVQVTTTPDGAQVLINDEVGTSPARFNQIPIGTHEVTVKLKGYETRTFSVTVENNGTVRKNLILTPTTADVIPAAVETGGSPFAKIPSQKPPAVAPPPPPAATAAVAPEPAPVQANVAPVVSREDKPRVASTPPVVQPKAKAAPSKAKVVVVPAAFEQVARQKFVRELNERFRLSDTSIIESPGLTGYLVDALVNARKFDVLEREQLRDVLKELDLAESDYADPAALAKVGQLMNADYVVVPVIQRILTDVETKEIPYIGKTRTTLKAHLAMHLRVVDARTSRISSSRHLEKDIEQRMEKKTFDQRKQVASFLNSLFENASRDAVASIIDTVYPLRILAKDGSRVTLNRGRGAVKPGDEFAVYNQGELMVDPDTQEVLGYMESEVGRIRVTQVMAKMSVAEILGDAAAVNKNHVCRQLSAVETLPKSPSPVIE